jgi:hypothetical protein
MSLSTTSARYQYAGNGIATAFAFPEKFIASADLIVVLTTSGVDTLQVITTNYTVAGALEPSGGTVTLLVAPATGTTVTIYRDPTATQPVQYVRQDDFPAESHERSLDRLTMLVQAALLKLKRSLRIPVTNGEIAEMTLAQRASKMLEFDVNGVLTFITKQSIIDAGAAASIAAAAAAAASAAAAALSAIASAESATESDIAATASELAQSLAEAAQALAEQAVLDAQAQVTLAEDEADAAAASAAAALASQVAALASQVAAAASAVTAANTIAATFKGGVAGNAVPNTLPLAGDYYRVTSAGTSQGKTWAIGDYAVYNGTSGAWTQLTGLFLPVTEEVDARFNSWVRDTGYIYSDGATSNRAQIQIPSARGNLAGAPFAEWCGWVLVPDAIYGADAVIVSVQSAVSGGVTNGLSILIGGGGNVLYIDAYGASYPSNIRRFEWSNFRNTYSGKRVWLEILFTNGTSNPVVRVDGANISASFSTNNTGTPPDWLSSSLVSTYHLTGYNWPAGEAPLGQWLNAHLTQAESDDWRTKGKIPVWVAAGGTCLNQVLSVTRNSDFSAGATDWIANTAGPTVGLSGTALSINSNSTAYGGAKLTSGFVVDCSAGAKYRITIDVASLSVTGAAPYLRFKDVSTYYLTAISANGTITLDFTAVESGTGTIEILDINGTGTYSMLIDNVVLTRFGALSLPQVQTIPIIDDVTRVGGNPARLVGMIGITQKRDWRIVKSTATNGNEQLLGGSVFLSADRNRIDSWVINNLGSSRTVSLGNASAGTQYASSITAAAGLNDVTPTTRFPATVELWAASNGTDTLVHTITGHRVGNQ